VRYDDIQTLADGAPLEVCLYRVGSRKALSDGKYGNVLPAIVLAEASRCGSAG
jgi:hypothetical protein